jgi:hypothetical protein
MRARKRTAFLFLFLTLFAILGWADLKPVRASAVNRVGLVVQFDDTTVVTRCIAFSENRVSGYAILQRSGLEIAAAMDAQGAAICKIGDQGCPVDSCFCAYPNYWSYWHLEGDHWQYSSMGASNYYVENGDVEGWRWGKGNPPVLKSFEEICASPTDTPTPTHPSPTPTPSLTMTPTATLNPPTPTQTQTTQLSSNPYPPPATPYTYTPPAYPPPGQQNTNVPYPPPSQPTSPLTTTSTPSMPFPSPTWTVAATAALAIPTAISPPPFDLERTEAYRIIATATALAISNITAMTSTPQGGTPATETPAPTSNETPHPVATISISEAIGYTLSGVMLFILAVGVFLLIVKQSP